MQKLRIDNFGPLSQISLDINDYTIFIGPQASGKSTISKAIYFFKSLRDDLVKYIYDVIENDESFVEPATALKKRIRAKFVSFWGTTKHLEHFEINYDFGNDKSILLFLKDGYVNSDFSQKFHGELQEIFVSTLAYIKKRKKVNKAYLSSNDILAFESEKRAFYRTIEEKANLLFDDDRIALYVPAGRSLLSTLSEPLQKMLWGRISSVSRDLNHIEESSGIDYLLDYPLKAFIDRISNLKPLYNQGLSDIIEDKKKLTTDKIDKDNLKIAKGIIEKILKGRYRYDKDGEKLFFSENGKYVKLTFASSGQQESIWILLQIFAIILNNTSCFIVIEEPEAHLYPVAQKDIVELITLLSNINKNQVILTTHSPYILSSVNNLLFAFKVGQNKEKEVENVIDKKLWINPKRIGSFYVEDGHTRNIVDPDLNLIKAEEIDNASVIINDQFNTLLNL